MTDPSIQLVHADYLTALAQIRRIGDELRRHRRTAETSLAVLLDGGWSGSASQQYAEGWQEWRAGCTAVLDSLDTLADLLAVNRADLVGSDALVGDRLSQATGALR